MIETVKQLGPYIAVTKDVAIAAARPEKGVKRFEWVKSVGWRLAYRV